MFAFENDLGDDSSLGEILPGLIEYEVSQRVDYRAILVYLDLPNPMRVMPYNGNCPSVYGTLGKTFL